MPSTTESTAYGYRSTFCDPVTIEETQLWAEEVRQIVEGRTTFGQLIDLRGRKRLSGVPEEEALIKEQMLYVRDHGLLRSAVVVANRQVALKIKQLAFGTAVYDWERYIDGADPQWERIALDWIERQIDPDRRTLHHAEPASQRVLGTG